MSAGTPEVNISRHPAGTILMAGLSWFIYVGMIVVEYSPEPRYSGIGLGSFHLYVAVIAALFFLCACGTVWNRVRTLPGHWFVGCLIGAILTAAGGYHIEQTLHHAHWHPEKSGGILIVVGCGLLLIPALPLTAIVVTLENRMRNG